MQAPTPHATNARPAALLALPGRGASCADHPRAPRFPAASAGAIGGRSKGPGYGRICGDSIRKLGQDRRYQKDQRGRAVACA
jgi:hypothetical protein